MIYDIINLIHKGDDFILICPKCGSDNTRIEVVNTIHLKRKRNWFYWISCLWMIDILLWIGMFLPRLIFQLLKGKTYKTTNKIEKHLICNDCGYNGKIK